MKELKQGNDFNVDVTGNTRTWELTAGDADPQLDQVDSKHYKGNTVTPV